MTLQDAAKVLISLRVALPYTVYAYLSMHNALRLEDFREYLSIKSSLFYCKNSYSTFSKQQKSMTFIMKPVCFQFWDNSREVKKSFTFSDRIYANTFLFFFFFPFGSNQKLSCRQTKCIFTASARRMCLQEQNSVTHLQFMNSLFWQLSNTGLYHYPQTRG